MEMENTEMQLLFSKYSLSFSFPVHHVYFPGQPKLHLATDLISMVSQWDNGISVDMILRRVLKYASANDIAFFPLWHSQENILMGSCFISDTMRK
jgi:hypothetical protein